MNIDLQLIRDHVNRPPLTVNLSLEEIAAAYRGQHIAIVGSGPSGRFDLSEIGVPIWAVGTAWIQHRTASLSVMMDDIKGPGWDEIRSINRENQRVDLTRDDWEPVWHDCPVPILSCKAYEDYPQIVEFPIAECLAKFGRAYFTESVSYALAWAIMIGVSEITFIGCDYDGVRPAERAGCEYWIGRAESAGIRINVCEGSTLLTTGPIDNKNRHIPGFYGYTSCSLLPQNGTALADLPYKLTEESGMALGSEAMKKLLAEPGIKTVLDIGCGNGSHAKWMADAGKRVTGIDKAGSYDYWEPFNGGSATLYPIDFLDSEMPFSERFDAIWTCHVLEHVDNPHDFLNRCFDNLNPGGLLAITIPPAQHAIVGGHFTLWNAGLLLYHLVRAGFDCREAKIKQYGYNLSVLVRKGAEPYDVPDEANFPIDRIKSLLPTGIQFQAGTFDGNIQSLNWDKE